MRGDVRYQLVLRAVGVTGVGEVRPQCTDEVARGMALLAMPDSLGDVGAAIPGRAFVRSRLKFPRGEDQPLPDPCRQPPAHVPGEIVLAIRLVRYRQG